MIFAMIPQKIDCPHFASCSGCILDEKVDKPPVLNDVEHYFENIQVFAGKPARWRCRAKLAVRGLWDNPLLGLYKEGSHDVLDIPHCQVHHPKINEAAEALRLFIKQEKIVPYNEQSGELRYVQFVLQRKTGLVQASLIINENFSSRWKDLTERLWKVNPDLWHSIWINVNQKRDNVILGTEWHLVQGQEWLWERVGGVEIAFLPASFGQANLNLFDDLVRQVQCWVPRGSLVAEFYCGAGGIGLNLVEQSNRLFCCEINAESARCFDQSLQRLSPLLQSKITYQIGSADKFTNWLEQVDVVVVDPPRKGLEASFLKALMNPQVRTKHLIYVSCGWKSFQRDAEFLKNSGWKISEASAFVLFPGTNHVELLVSFTKQ